MKSLYLFLFIFSLLFCSCKKDESPVGPKEKRSISMNDFSSYIDSLYYKVWSDSSWEKFSKTMEINNKEYIIFENNFGDEDYYSIEGYAGFKPYGESVIMFDEPLSPLPDELVFGEPVTREVTFSDMGNKYNIKFVQTLVDTESVSVPIGSFNPCLWIKSDVTVSSGTQSQGSSSEVWIAKGPSDIKIKSASATIMMVRGRINGREWGSAFLKTTDNQIEFFNNLSRIFIYSNKCISIFKKVNLY